MAENQLPKGWVYTKIEDISESVQYGYTAKTDNLQPIKYLRITDIQNNQVDWEKVPGCPILEKDFERYALRSGDIVFARTGATVGKSFLIKEVVGQSVYASYLIRVRLINLIDGRLIRAYFDSHAYWQQITENSSGIGQPNVNGTKLKALIIPLPPLAEQQRIVAKLDKLFTHLEETKTRLNKIPQLLKNFRQSVLTQAVTGKLTEDWRKENKLPQWENGNLSEILKFKQGIQIDVELQTNESTNGKLPFLRIINYTQKDPRFTFVDKDTYEKHNIKSNEIVMVRYGATAGFVGTGLSGVLANNLFTITPEVELDNKLLYFILKSPTLQNILLGKRKGGAMPAISFKLFNDISVEYPNSTEEQKLIVQKVEFLLSKINTIEDKYSKIKETIETLPQSILAKAFKGELVEQLPTDGDAQELLDEIKKLKAQTTKKKK